MHRCEVQVTETACVGRAEMGSLKVSHATRLYYFIGVA